MHFWNEKEIILCEKLNLHPHEYLLIKDFLIRESVKTGFITKDFADGNIKIGTLF